VRGLTGRHVCRGASEAGFDRRLDETPRVALTQNLCRERRVQRVPAAMHDEMSLNRMADEREVADDIQNLVTHELVFEPQRIEHGGLAEDDGVFERAAQREPALTQHLDFLEESEGARGRDLVNERALVQIHRFLLMTEKRVVEADRVADLESIGRIERDALVALLDLNVPQNLDRLARHAELFEPPLLAVWLSAWGWGLPGRYRSRY